MKNNLLQLKTPTLASCLFLGLMQMGHADDIPGGNDHPLISRYPASSIIFNTVSEFDEYHIPLSTPYRISGRDYAAEQDETLEGKITRLVYASDVESSDLQIHKNYVAAFARHGFTVIRECQGAGCETNAKTFGRFLQQDRVSYRDKAEAYFVAAKYTPSGAAPVYFSILNGRTNSGYSHIVVDIIETKNIELEIITTNADALLENLANSGRAAIYDIYFDTGQSVIKPDSKSAMEAIVAVLTSQPELELYVVGHTDDTGTVAANTRLANERAIAIVNYLGTELGVSKTRLHAAGAGPFAPVASNDTVKGRAMNRRVEIVKRLRP